MEELGSGSNGSTNDLPEIITSRFQIEGILGRGGMGTVYRAKQLSLDRVVALKVINSEYAANTDIVKRFAREARLMAKLRHPRAAMIYDTESLPDGRSFIVMEYVPGVSLAQVLKEEGRLSYQQAVAIAVSICDVLQAAHSIGIVHRDLKPANIMLNKDGVFVLDFGIAKMLESENEDNLGLSMTGTGVLVGSPYYMSPEQCLGQPVEARSDLYSLGVLLYECLAGNPPFTDKTLSAVVIKHATAEHPSLSKLREDVPPALISVINQLLAKNPEERPANAAAARALLEAAASGQPLPVSTNNVTGVASAPEGKVTQQIQSVTGSNIKLPDNSTKPVSKSSNSSLKLGIAAAAVLAVVGATGIFIWLSQTGGWKTIGTASNSANKTAVANHQHHDMSNMDTDFVANMPNEDKTNTTSAPLLSTEEADEIITKITQTTSHHADGMQIVKTPKDTALVCLHNKVAEGKTHVFVVERPNINSPWDISARVSLDTPEFQSPNWTFEPRDVDGDGFEEVIFVGTNVANAARRALLYVPRTRQSYTILREFDSAKKSPKTQLSPNALSPSATAFRTALEQVTENK